MDATQKPKRTLAKKSFNLEPDVFGLFTNWKACNPNVIEGRMFNQAMRAHLAAFKRAPRKEKAA